MNRRQQLGTLVLIAAVSIFFAISDPSKVSSLGLIAGFLLLMTVIYQLIYGLLTVGGWYGLELAKSSRRRFAGTATGIMAVVIALQSTGQLSGRDIAVLIPLMVGFYLYAYAAHSE